MKSIIRKFSLLACVILLLSGCGGGGGSGNNTVSYTNLSAAEIQNLHPSDMKSVTAADLATWGANIQYLCDACFEALSYVATAGGPNGSGQVGAITAVEIASLTPAQVRLIGAAGPGGSITTSQITQLNSGAWAALVSDPVQVAAITPAEIATLTEVQVVAMGTNIQYLTDGALAALTPWSGGRLVNGQIESITVAQITALTPAQVRMIGAAGPGGSITTSQIAWLNTGAWAALVSDPAQVAAITAAEIPTLWDAEIAALGTNIQYLSDAAMGAITVWSSGANPNFSVGHLESITAAQVAVLTPAQITLLANGSSPFGAGTAIAYMNLGAFGALNATQVSVLTPSQIIGVSATQLASLSTTAIAGLSAATIASLTATQTSLLSPQQHTACGC